MKTFITVFGSTGLALILIAFIQEQRGAWKRTDTIYDFTNFIGASMVVVYEYSHRAWPFVILNGIWALYSLHDWLKDTVAAERRLMTSKKSDTLK